MKTDASVEPFGLNAEAWTKWCDYRRKLKKAYRTEFAIERAQRKLASFGEHQMLVVERSMENEWRGLFPLPKDTLIALEKAKKDMNRTRRVLEELQARAAQVGFRGPLRGEDEVGYRTLVERAEHQHAMSKLGKRGGVVPIADLLRKLA